MKALQQRIVQLARDTRALVDAFVEASLVLTCDLADADAIAGPHQHDGGYRDQRLEPSRLGIRRRNRERERCTGVVPYSAVVAGPHPKRVRAGSQIGIERLSPRADILPLGVAPFEHDPKRILLGGDEAERRVVNLQIADERRQPHTGRRIVGTPIGDELFDVHRRRYRVMRQVRGIDERNAVLSRQPDFSVGIGRHVGRHGQR